MAELTTTQKTKPTLSRDSIRAIEKILASGGNAKVSTGKSGVTVYEEKVKIAYPQS